MTAPIQQQRLLIQTPQAQLEALAFTAPQRAGGAAAVILHPYSLLGGTMNDPMVKELFRVAATSPAFSFVLRYNQRGVGRSAGRMNVWGKEDAADVLDVVEFAAAQLPGPDKQVAVIGYSWGGCVAAHGLAHPAVAAYVGVSFPLGGLSWVLQTRRHFAEVCRATHVPRLLVLGDQDQFTRESAMREAVLQSGGYLLRPDDSFVPEVDAAASLQGTAAGRGASATAGPSSGGNAGSSAAAVAAAGGMPGAARRDLLLRVFPDSDHFWLSHGSLAATYVVGWLETLLRRQRGESLQAEAAPLASSAAGPAVEGPESQPAQGSAAGPADAHSSRNIASAAAGISQVAAAAEGLEPVAVEPAAGTGEDECEVSGVAEEVQGGATLVGGSTDVGGGIQDV